MIGLEVVNVLVEGSHPELFAHEDDGVQLVLEPRVVT